jgi:hypothetical protein
MNTLTANENNRKTHTLVYNEKKGTLLAAATAGQNNGDIINWETQKPTLQESGGTNAMTRLAGKKWVGNKARQLD